ncbi:tumor necrosis factor ligand superfamily member 6-like isoform X1 [Hemitrygon akajei]|uniref:tumor necrosis factor ligand superfamily member 6-like isoform X1 n=1 Tax=Hemitrygon akajei TaxID=2704970 RepID=UPI003BF9906D
MEHRDLQSLEMREAQNRAASRVTSAGPLAFPVPRIEKKMKCIATCASLIAVMLALALAGLTFTIHSLYNLHREVAQINEINGSPQNTPQKLTGAAKKNKTEDDTERAAHLTGKATAQHSDRLMWDIRMGNAFMQGFTYRNGTLIINKTGKYYIYSKIHFRGENCPLMPLHQTILKHDNTYQLDQTLMRVQEINFCSGHGLWRKTTFQAGIFHLKRGVQLFVQVSDPTMVSLDELMTFFGIYKI